MNRRSTQCADVLHDCGYRWFEIWGIERAGVARLFGEALRADQTGVFRTQAMVTAVRFFEQTPWTHRRRLGAADKGIQPIAPTK